MIETFDNTQTKKKTSQLVLERQVAMHNRLYSGETIFTVKDWWIDVFSRERYSNTDIRKMLINGWIVISDTKAFANEVDGTCPGIETIIIVYEGN